MSDRKVGEKEILICIYLFITISLTCYECPL